MTRIKPITNEAAPLPVQEAFQQHITTWNARITNMKATLGHSLLAFDIYMQWYPLYQKIVEMTGERAAYLYAWSISNASNCPLCSTFFRKIIIEKGENPEHLVLDEYEEKLLDFGSAIAQHRGCIANHVYNKMSAYHNEEEMVLLIAFAGQMVATNIFNNVVETEIDTYLQPFLPAKFTA